ncbi:MAG: D-alanine--D-alanine ligase family protein [Anaerolineae bacterium]
MSEKKKLRVGVIFGGKSGEHEVSLNSARNVMDAIDKRKYEVVPIGINKQGMWLTGPNVYQELTSGATLPGLAAPAPQKSEAEKAPTDRALVPFLDDTVVARDAALGQLDVIFPVVHGPLGEDGTVQGFLELAGIPYVGAGVAASAVGMDKALSKAVFRAHGLPLVRYEVLLRKRWRNQAAEVLREIEAEFTYPVFVKPANMGSSVGVNKADDATSLEAALDEAAQYDRKLIVEQGIDAREIEVSVLGNDEPIASVAGEIIPSREFYSYAAKYLDEGSQLLIPAPLIEEHAEMIRELAVMAYKAIDCAGMARVDFLVEKGTGEIFLNEVNTIPGFTAISMYPKLWQATGVSYTELIDRLIELALERHADRQGSKSDFDLATAR